MSLGTSGDQSIKITCSKKSPKLIRLFYWMSVILDLKSTPPKMSWLKSGNRTKISLCNEIPWDPFYEVNKNDLNNLLLKQIHISAIKLMDISSSVGSERMFTFLSASGLLHQTRQMTAVYKHFPAQSLKQIEISRQWCTLGTRGAAQQMAWETPSQFSKAV